MTQYDNEFFRGPPEGSPTLATDQRPTGVEVFQAKPEATTVVADVPVTREEVPKDPPKKKSNARRITKAIKLLASCMAAVVITEAAVNIAATVEPQPEEIPTGQYYVGQWPGVSAAHNGVYVREMDADMGYSIQMPLGEDVWRLTADTDWRMVWYEGGIDYAFFGLRNMENDVFIMADLTAEPYYTEYEDDCYTTMTTSTGETLYIRAFFNSLGKYAEEYGIEENGQSEEMLAASAQLRQELVEEAFAGIQVTPGTEAGWQGFQIGNKLYSQQSENWYGLGGFGDLEIHIPWVNYADDYNLHNMTPYSRVNVNGITWSIYFAENDTYLWAVPNIDPEICLGGLTARFMCADAVRRGEYINDDEWGGFTSVSQRQTAVDILVECLQHHYALRDRWYPRDWPWKGATDDASYWVWAESVKGTWVQFAFGDTAYRVNSTDPELRFHWERTSSTGNDQYADLEISRMVQNEEVWAVDLTIRRTPFKREDENCSYRTVQATGEETLYLEFRSQYHAAGADFTTEEMGPIVDQILRAITFQSNPDDSGWSTMLLCDTMHSPQNMEWSGSGIVGSAFEIRYIHTVESEGLKHENPIGTRSHNGITWTLYYDRGDEDWRSCIWAVPDIEPDVCIGFEILIAMNYYRDRHMDHPEYEWDETYELTAEDVNQAADAVSEALAYIYPLGVEPDAQERWYIPDWPMIGQTSMEHSYNLMAYSRYGTYSQFSLGSDAYRLDSDNPHLCFFWNETAEVDGVMQADLYISHMTDDLRDWRVQLLVQEEPFGEYTGEDMSIDSIVPVNDGRTLYLRFVCRWEPDQNIGVNYEMFSEWAQTVMDAITASAADPNGWGQVWICDLMTTPLGPNWDGNAMVTENYEIPYFNRVEEQGLTDLEPYAMLEFNGIVWTFVYEEADDIIWGIPDIEDRWCIGAPAREMAAWFLGGMPEEDYLDAAVEGLSEGLSKYYPRRGFVIEPESLAPDWPSIVSSDDGSDVTFEIDSERNTGGVISLDGYVFEIEFYREDLRFLWDAGKSDFAKLQVYSMHGGRADWGVTMEARMTPFETDGGDNTCDRSINMGGGTYLYCRFESWNLNDTPVDVLADEIVKNMSVDYAGKEEFWHTVYIGKTLQTQQSYDWTGLEMVYEDYGFWYVHDAEAYDIHQQDYKGQRSINGILWTFRFHKDNDVFYAYPDTEPELCIGADPGILYDWYEAQYGAQEDYFETLVESMCVGLQNITLR